LLFVSRQSHQSSFDLSELETASSLVVPVAKHPALGFSGMTVGYARPLIIIDAVPGPETGRLPCPRVGVKTELVVTDQRLEIARDLRLCQVPAVIAHYRRHAAAASLALHRFATELSPRLEEQVEFYLRENSLSTGADIAELQDYLDESLDQALGAFIVSVPDFQQVVDTPAEIRALNEPCSST